MSWKPPVLLHDLHWISAKMNTLEVTKTWKLGTCAKQTLKHRTYIYILHVYILYILCDGFLLTSFAAGGCHYPKNCRIHHKKSCRICKGLWFYHHIFTNCGLIANDGRTTIIRWSTPADNRFSTSVDAPIDGGCPQNPQNLVVSHKFPHSNGRCLDIPKSIHLFPWYPSEVVGCIRHLCGFNSPFLKHLGLSWFFCVCTPPQTAILTEKVEYTT